MVPHSCENKAISAPSWAWAWAELGNILKKKIKEAAFKYLVSKQGKKGGEIKYKSLQMVDYLLPYNSELSNKEKKRNIFNQKWKGEHSS